MKKLTVPQETVEKVLDRLRAEGHRIQEISVSVSDFLKLDIAYEPFEG